MLGSVEKIDIEVRSLETCSYNSQTFRDVLGKIQRAVDELNLHSYSNLPQWVATLDLQVKCSVMHEHFYLKLEYDYIILNLTTITSCLMSGHVEQKAFSHKLKK